MNSNVAIKAQELFEDSNHQKFPVCTQVTLSHGICDSCCISCPIGRLNYGDANEAVKAEFQPPSRKFMPWEIFTRVADEVAQYPHAWLRMHARGEPLLHPHFVDMVQYAKAVGISLVQAFTNAITLDGETSIAILKAGLDVLECSIHGHTETYELLMRNGQFERVKNNIIHFRQLREQLGARTKLVVSAVDQPQFQLEKQGNYTLPCCHHCQDWTGSAWGKGSYEHLFNVKLGLEKSDEQTTLSDTITKSTY